MTPPYAVIFLAAPGWALLAKLTTTNGGISFYYKPLLSGPLDEVDEIVELLNAAVFPTEPISETTP